MLTRARLQARAIYENALMPVGGKDFCINRLGVGGLPDRARSRLLDPRPHSSYNHTRLPPSGPPRYLDDIHAKGLQPCLDRSAMTARERPALPTSPTT